MGLLAVLVRVAPGPCARTAGLGSSKEMRGRLSSTLQGRVKEGHSSRKGFRKGEDSTEKGQ